jgi:hypothetical protein
MGIVQWSEIKYTLTASSRFPAAYLAERLRRLEARWRKAHEATRRDCDAKFVLNAMCGIWSILDHNVFHLDVASDPDDVVATIMRKTPSPGSEHNGAFLLHDYMTKTHVRTFSSTRPFHQICLSMERLLM